MTIVKRPWGITTIAAFDLAFAGCVTAWGQILELTVREFVSHCAVQRHRGVIACGILVLLGSHLVVVPGLFLLKRWAYRLQLALTAAQTVLALAFAAQVPVPYLVLPPLLVLALFGVYLGWPGTRCAFGGGPAGTAPRGLELSVAAVGTLSAGALSLLAALTLRSGVFLHVHGSANESATLGDLRTIVSAEAVFASRHAGSYATLDCLADPGTCVAADEAPYLDEHVTLSQKSGYRRQFHPGPGVPPASLGGYAVTAVPIEPDRTGCRSYCADDTGTICWMDSGEPAVHAGRCDLRTCTALR